MAGVVLVQQEFNLTSYPVNRECSSCRLSTKCAVSGQSIAPIKEVKLIVIGGFPAGSDEKAEQSFCPLDLSGFQKEESYGAFIHNCFSRFWQPSFLKYVYFTQAIKCGKRQISITNQERQKCQQKWLLPELKEFAPTVPILLMGNEALKALFKTRNFADSRQKILRYNHHPVVVTFDPQTVQNSMLKVFTADLKGVTNDLTYLYQTRKATRQNVNKIALTQTWRPLLPGSMAYFFLADLKLLNTIINPVQT